MGTASTGYPFGTAVHSYGNSAVLSRKLEFSRFNFPFPAELSRINLNSGSVFHFSSKSSVCKIHSLPDIDNIFWDKVPTPLLDVIDNPIHLKNLSLKELKQLAEEIRSELASFLSNVPASHKASLAVVELTVALHHVFHAPVDKILWDAGEETYAHKILTGRRPLMSTLHKKNGISGSTSRLESEFDPFGAAHGCNSVSAGLGTVDCGSFFVGL